MWQLQGTRSSRSLALALLMVAGSAAWAADACDVPAGSWQPRSAVHALAQRNGWQVQKLKIDDGCYEIKGLDAQGRRFKARLDPASLKVIALKRADRDRDQDRDVERQRERSDEPASGPPSGRDPA